MALPKPTQNRTPFAPRRRRRQRHAVVALSNVRVPETTYSDLCIAANRRGLTNAAYVRMVLLGELDRERANGHLPTSPITPALGIAPAGLQPR